MTYDPASCADRLGKLTASKAGVIMGGLDTSGLETYVKSLAWARVYGARDAEFQNSAMQRGNDLEPLALDWYEFQTGQDLQRSPGFIAHESVPYVGASPDALVLRQGKPSMNVQVKCPLHGAWMEARRTMKVPAEYRWQCRWEAWVTGMPEHDFVVWHPAAGGLVLQMRTYSDEIDQMAERAALVEARVQKWVDILRGGQ